MVDGGHRGATRIQGYWAGGERFDTPEEMLAAHHRSMVEREAREAERLRAQQERQRQAKRRRIRARYGHDRPVATRRKRRGGG